MEYIRRFFGLLLLFLVEDHKFRKDTLLVSYFSALTSCFSTSSASAMFGSRPFKKTSTGGLGIYDGMYYIYMKFWQMSTWFFLDFTAQFSCVKNNMSSLFSRCGWSKATPKLVSPRYVKNPTQLTLASVEYDGTWSFGRNHSEAVSPKNNLGDLVEFCVSIVGSTYQIRT